MSPFPLAETVPLAPGALVRIERVERPAGRQVPQRFMHFHAPAELVLFEQGTGEVYCSGWSARFVAGTAVFVPALAAHDFSFAEGPLAWSLLQFDPLAIAGLGMRWPDGPAAVELDPVQAARARMLVEWLAEGVDRRAPGTSLALRLAALLALLEDGRTLSPDGARPLGLGRFGPLLERLQADPGSAPRLTAAATACAMSPAYFSRQFSATFGSTYARYVENLRLQRGSASLATGTEPVALIAYRLGFRSHAHFSARFRKLFGCSPSDYRSRRLAGV